MADGISSTVADGVSSKVAGDVFSKMTEGVASKVAEDVFSKMPEIVSSNMAENVTSNVAQGVSSKVAEGATSTVADGISSTVADDVTSNVVEGVSSKVAENAFSKVDEGVTSKVAEEVCSEAADRRGGAAEAASLVEEMCSPNGIPADQTKKEAVTAVINDTGRATKKKPVEWTSEAIRAAQEADSEIKAISVWKEPPGKEVIMVHGFATRSYVQQWDKLHLKEGVLYQLWESSNGLHVAEQLVVPSGNRRAIIQLAHEEGHFGVDRTAEQEQRRAYWVGWRRDVIVELGRCANCTQYYRVNPQAKLDSDCR